MRRGSIPQILKQFNQASKQLERVFFPNAGWPYVSDIISHYIVGYLFGFKNDFLDFCVLCLCMFARHRNESAVREEFTNGTSSAPLLVTAGCGGTGINLQPGSVIIQMEVWWNMNHERQAYARCLRQGQDKMVKVYKLFAENSNIDIMISKCQVRKDKLNSQVMKPLVRKDDDPLIIPALHS
ncbi:P-loop containing nucleoside triphosphate hydrolase protein [Aspergillus flavus]|uniref:P-loop containing nucleoside triphosphate hydrolase protein n=1 Tax=Aspergillus flavus (strain ATCC 200026 / FGSC A1120 / IAM 13836 / NRRL 3357 / JCM 12722 / SRRC 167) TaxID=332952 RepID=A0A7U2ML40_ASPFN|nr:uncharacterized protein G4B84_004728 [Aspergillus flavus NRRL3357]KAF7618057.1 hypothetical protein AFLA_006961 [Aspergillus flavus NRRL3357]QMW29393.1 hypothetical protein G4B84_004728 [Aspergillus flavus NRRL3357]QRD85742.1 P-loop containing nucleoside triphosphate hydrolase protein [Aspergillus flavus]